MQRMSQIFFLIKNIIQNYISIMYQLFKEIWYFRYYFLLFSIFITTFSLNMLTINRVIRFVIICAILIIYKKAHNYIEKKEYNFNIKNLMWINIIQNPVLYIIWKWDIYMYEKYEKKINYIIKNKKLKNILIIIFWNISMPIKILYIRFYKTLNVIKILTLKEFMFSRIYGFVVSILIFSDIIKYILNITEGILYLILYIYIIMYSINVMYTWYNIQDEDATKKVDSIKILKIKKLIKKTIIYRKAEEYLEILKNIEINQVYEYRIAASIIGSYIKNSIIKAKIIDLDSIINKMPEQWRFWIYNNRILFKEDIFYISYKEGLIMSKIVNLKIYNILSKQNFNIKYLYNCYEIYIHSIHSLQELFKAFESILYYKYFELKKGVIEKYSNTIKNTININEYEYIYKMYFLILKNIIFYIWSYEYSILKDKNKLTKFYVIEDSTLEFGYHIYSKDINKFNPYDTFSLLVSESDLDLIWKNNKSQSFNYLNIEILNENIYILSKIINLTLPNTNLLIYIEAKENQELKNINKLYNKYMNLISINENDISLLKTEIASEYFIELKNVMDILYKEWEQGYMNKNDMLKNTTVLFELMCHSKNKCV